MEPIEVAAAQITVIAPFLLKVIRNGQNAVSNGDNGTLAATLGGKAAELCRKVSVLGARGRPGALAGHATQPGTALACLAAQALTGTLAIPGTKPGPTRQVCCCGELLHGNADLCC